LYQYIKAKANTVSGSYYRHDDRFQATRSRVGIYYPETGVQVLLATESVPTAPRGWRPDAAQIVRRAAPSMTVWFMAAKSIWHADGPHGSQSMMVVVLAWIALGKQCSDRTRQAQTDVCSSWRGTPCGDAPRCDRRSGGNRRTNVSL